ncbi:MAG: hypothetical protein ACYTFW_25765 [Planctomycetota bacterium]|jgi:hypothetical protein
MSQLKKLIVKDSPKTTTERVSVPILPQVLQILSKSEKGVHRYAEEAGLEFGGKRRNKPSITAKLERERDIIAELAIQTLLYLGYPASPAGSS